MKYVLAIAFLIFVCVLAGCGPGDNGTTAGDYYKKAFQFIDAGHPAEAVDLLSLAIKKDPNFYDAYYNRGVIHYVLKHYPAAIDDLSRAIEINPKSSDAYGSRGEVYESMKKIDEAFDDYRTAARMGNQAAQDYLTKKNLSW